MMGEPRGVVVGIGFTQHAGGTPWEVPNRSARDVAMAKAIATFVGGLPPPPKQHRGLTPEGARRP